MKLALSQMKMKDNTKDNLQRALSDLKKAAENGADLIAYPELTLYQFFPQYEKKDVSHLAIDKDHEYINAFVQACRENQIYALPNFYLKENGKKYDASVLIDRTGDILGVQKMVHIAQCDNFYEQDYYAPSDDGFKVFDTEFGKIGAVICFDRHYPESIRTEALRGADLILIPTANTIDENMEMFEKELSVQSFQNSVVIAMCNRAGVEDKMYFAGESIVVDMNGNTLCKADSSDTLVYAEVDISKSSIVRSLKPYTQLRRQDLYE